MPQDIKIEFNSENMKEYVNNRVDMIKKYQKYVNTELDNGYFALDQDYRPVVGQYVPFTKKFGNMEVTDGHIKIKAGKIYQFICSVGYHEENKDVFADIVYIFKNITSGESIAILAPVRNNKIWEKPFSVNFQYCSNEDCEIGLYVNAIYTSDILERTYTNLSVFEIGHDIVIDPVDYVNEENGIEDTPVGHIISHMGTKAPKHYLICDGTEYNIMDYPFLAQHIKDDFGEYNFFGGDGTTTFAVPDLRGEFLRGTGVNSHEKQGNGSGVGEHQNATNHPFLASVSDGSSLYAGYKNNTSGNYIYPSNVDVQNMLSGSWKTQRSATTLQTTTDSRSVSYTSRPTNTSVLYCIKYEPTYFMKSSMIQYSYDEHWVGYWVNGKPLYERTIDFGTLPNSSVKTIPHGIENVETIWIYDGFVFDTRNGNHSQINFPSSDGYSANWSFYVNKTDIVSVAVMDRTTHTAMVTVRYTKQ